MRASELPPLCAYGPKCTDLLDVRILRRLRAAAGPHTKLIIGDMLQQYACKSPGHNENEGTTVNGYTSNGLPNSPLLPNLGKANVAEYLLDILVRRS